MNTAIIGMGTNLGDRMDNLNRAVQALKRLPRTKVTGASHLYETQPVGVPGAGAVFECQPNG